MTETMDGKPIFYSASWLLIEIFNTQTKRTVSAWQPQGLKVYKDYKLDGNNDQLLRQTQWKSGQLILWNQS